VSTDLDSRLTTASEVRGARCTSLSLGGMFLETELRPEYGSIVTIEMHTLNGSEVIRFEAVVRWFDTRGIGLQFTAMGARETHALAALIESARSHDRSASTGAVTGVD
jgi:hypothetical protein